MTLPAVLLATIFCLGLAAPATAADQPLTLGEAMLLALKHNPGLKAAGMTLETAEAEMAKARARFLPTLDFGETYNYSDSATQVFMNKLNQRVFTQQDFLLNNLNFPNPLGNFRTGLTMSQPIFQAGQAYLGYRQAQLGREEAGALVLSSRQQLLFRVTQAYFGLHLARETLGIVKKAVETARQHLNIAEERYRSGAVIQADVLSAQVHLAKITQEEITAEGQVQVAQSSLATLVGLPEIGSRALAPPPREPAPLPENLTDLQTIAQEKRPDLKRLALAARVAQQEYTKARLNYLPRVRLVAEYDVDQRRLFGASPDSYTIMALMNFNLFNGLADLARVRESRAQEAQAQDLKQELEDRIRQQVTEAIISVKTAQARLKVARTAVAQARESLRLVRLRYQTGLTILVDLLTTEDAAKNAELDQAAALFDTYLSQAGLELALGTISGPAEAVGAGP
ncbi:MAG: TolC family protein [Desulfobaccales bacterium]|jgi:TolC family type I secretion outer membrane protein